MEGKKIKSRLNRAVNLLRKVICVGTAANADSFFSLVRYWNFLSCSHCLHLT